MTSAEGADANRSDRRVGTVFVLRRYPVKSMLGQVLSEAEITMAGVTGDRVFALVDEHTGRIASAKQPRLWRLLLQCTAAWRGTQCTITLPGDRSFEVSADDATPQLLSETSDVDRALSDLLGRAVRLTATRRPDAEIARPSPEDVIEHGQGARLPYELLQIGEGTPGSTFVDYAPVSIFTTSTLGHLGLDEVRYRPNVVIDTPTGSPYEENDWVGRELRIGQVSLRGLIPIPRCAIPTLEHGDLPRSLDAVRRLLTENRIAAHDSGPAPCAGLYAEVLTSGTIRPGDTCTVN